MKILKEAKKEEVLFRQGGFDFREFPNMSFSDKLIVAAADEGYGCTLSGLIYSPRSNRFVKGGTMHGGHKCFMPATRIEGKKRTVLQHRFAYYIFHGKDCFRHFLIRHINGVPTDNRIENIAGGTAKENRADIPREVLCAIGKTHVDRLVEMSRKLSDLDVASMRSFRKDTGLSYKRIGEHFNVSTMTAYRCCVGQSWGNI